MRLRATAACVLAIFAVTASADQWLPDHKRTPGATNPDITQQNIHETICNTGNWTTKSIRPPVSYTNRLKRQQIAEYGYADKRMQAYEEDHLIPLTIGGHPSDPRNLWPEPWDGEHGAREKDKLENKLHSLVCTGKLSLAEAQKAISSDWIAAYRKFVLAAPRQ